MRSDEVVVAAPMSFAGSAERIWKMTEASALLIPVALVLVVLAWCVVVAWYVLFGLLAVPYRLIRRGQRKRKREDLRHQETIEAMRRPR